MANMMFKKKKDGKGEGMDPLEKEARTTAIQAMRKMAEDEMSGKLKKVTVASNSPVGLKEGLTKAKEMLSKDEPMLESEDQDGDMEEGMDHEAAEGQAEENSEHGGDSGPSDLDGMSEAEIDAKLEELMKLKSRKGIKTL